MANIIQSIKNRWYKDKVGTSFELAVVVIALLSLFKPTSNVTFYSLAAYFGISLITLSIILLGAWYLIKKR